MPHSSSRKIFDHVSNFLKRCCITSSPLLLALSGGTDSLFLFYALLRFREKEGVPFAVAHVDHRWRKESKQEGEILRQLAIDNDVPFYLKTLDPARLQGNLEAACREERYKFFKELVQQHQFQALLTGHHLDDQSETVLKRFLEGAHWSCWQGLRKDSWMGKMRVLRPLLEIEKKEISQALSENNLEGFDDPTNRDVKYLRARMRQEIFPWLNECFGKRIEKNLGVAGKEIGELADYFDELLSPLLKEIEREALTLKLNLGDKMPRTALEVKYLLRLLCRQEQIFLSREIIEKVATTLHSKKGKYAFAMGKLLINVERGCLSIKLPFELRNFEVSGV